MSSLFAKFAKKSASKSCNFSYQPVPPAMKYI
ncbi:AgrD family cyclic lactone autoinducer peptide [uncultured Phascolarctobacterium sp.]